MLKNKDLISVIIPIYNVEKYIKKTIDTILVQTYTNIEIILVDDGSSDKSGDICDIYAKKDNRIRVFHQENKGVSSARNLGINNAKGKYIVFVDGDDYVTPEYINSLYSNIIENKADLAVQMYLNYYSSNRKIRNVKENINTNMSGREFIDFEILEGRDTTVYVKIYSKDIIDKFKIRFNESISNLEDMLFLFYYCTHCNKINYTSIVNYYRIVRNDGVAFSKFNKKKLTALKVFDIIDSELRTNYSKDFVIKNIVNKFNTIVYFCSEIIYENKGYKETLKSLLLDSKQIYRKYKNHIDIKLRLKFFSIIYIPSIYIILKRMKMKLYFL